MTIDILKSLFGRHLGITRDYQLVSRGGVVSGGYDRPSIVFPGPDTVAIYDDFLGDLVADEWNAATGSDTGSHKSAAITAATNGVLRVTSGAAYADSGAGISLNGELNWKANQGRLRCAARIKIPTITTISAFVGFTDTKAQEPPIFEDTGTAAQVSNASDAVGFLFDTANSHTTFQLVAVAGNTDATPVDLATGPTANVYEELEVLLDASGNATFLRNGNEVGYIASAVTPTVALTPVVAVYPHATSARSIDVDYHNTSAARDTGT